WSRDAVVRGQLKRINHPQNFVEVSARARRIGDHQLDLLIGTNHVDRADCECVTRVGVNHVIKVRYFTVTVCDHRKIALPSLTLFNFVRPFSVLISRIDAQSDYLYVARFEVRLQPRCFAKLSCAHWCEVFWM